jgi:hypothetical protein
MDNEEIVLLLREIRDLQKLHVENYKDALKNQQASIDLQSNAIASQNKWRAILLIFVLVAVVTMVWASLAAR